MNILELVEQMPATDRELEAQKTGDAVQQAAAATEASKFTAPDPALAAKICDEILAGGRSAVIDLIKLIHPPGDPQFKNYKAEYLLHCLTIHVGNPGREAQKKSLVATLAAQIGDATLAKPVRAFLIRELQLLAGKESLRVLSQQLADEDLCQPAAAALQAIGDSGVDYLYAALPRAKGKCRLMIVQSLAACTSGRSVSALRKALQDQDSDVRLAAAWGLAQLGDAGSADPLLKLADGATGFERIKATQACLQLAEIVAGTRMKSATARIYTHLRDTRTDPKEKYIRDLASQALQT